MSRSSKKVAAGTCLSCKSQKWGKMLSHRKFRRRERLMMQVGRYEDVPQWQRELRDSWELGGDGKMYWGTDAEDEEAWRDVRK